MPGGIVLFCLMPIVGRLVNFVQARYLIAFGMFINAIGMWATGTITPQTDYITFIIVRIFQVMGLSFLFVSTSALAFSRISHENSNNASAIASLMRNLGGSIGISLITNKLIHSQQIEQATLSQHLATGSLGFHNTFMMSCKTITDIGISGIQVTDKANMHVYQELIRQASVLAYRDSYNLIGSILLVLCVIALFMPKNIQVEKV